MGKEKVISMTTVNEIKWIRGHVINKRKKIKQPLCSGKGPLGAAGRAGQGLATGLEVLGTDPARGTTTVW